MSINHFEKLEALITEGIEVLNTKREGPWNRGSGVDYSKCTPWVSGTMNYLKNYFLTSANVYIEDLDEISKRRDFLLRERYHEAKQFYTTLCKIRQDVETGIIVPDSEVNRVRDTIPLLRRIFMNFHKSLMRLRTTHDKRQTMSAKNEYDVQYFLFALLELHFDNILAEEPVPSSVGAASRIDFLLRDERIGIEVKHIKSSTTIKGLSSEMIEDATRYREHPHFDKLIFFIYNPSYLLKSLNAIAKDIIELNKDFVVDVVIGPA